MRYPMTVRPRGFSLIELLIVIIIIALIVAILLPVLGSVKDSGRESATRNMMSDVATAISSYQISERRMPGYFPAREMGGADNETQGFTAMENILLDLSGGVVATSGGTPPAIQVGPNATATRNVYFRPELVGVVADGNKGYFAPPPSYYKLTDGTDNAGTKMAGNNNKKVRDLVDAWGMPILAWVADPLAVQPVQTVADFAKKKYDDAPTAVPARFCMASNAAFLQATQLGQKGIDQNTQSLIGYAATPAAATTTLCGLLGAPGAPVDSSLGHAAIRPSTPRGTFTLQCAGNRNRGQKGIYVGKQEPGAPADGQLYYGFNFKNASDAAITDDQGKPTSRDVTKDFDDLFISGG